MLFFARSRRRKPRLLSIVLQQQGVSLSVAEYRSGASSTGETATIELSSVIINDHLEATPKSWVPALQKLFLRYKKHLDDDLPVQISLGIGCYQNVSIDRPNLEGEELAAGLKFAVRELVSLPPTQIVADYYEIPAQPAGSNKINVVVADKRQLEPVLKIIADESLALQGISIAELAVARMMQNGAEPNMLLVQAPNEPLSVQIIGQQQLYLSRQVRGFEMLPKLTTDEIKLGALEPLSVEMQRSLDYFGSQLRQRPVTKVRCALALQSPQAVHESLAAQLGLEVSQVRYPGWAQELAAGDYSDFVALGGLLLLNDALHGAPHDETLSRVAEAS